MSLIKKFLPLKRFNTLFVKTFKLVSLLGGYTRDDEYYAFIVTKDDNFYVIGENEFGCLGLENVTSVAKLTNVDELCGKSIQNIANGFNHVIALSKDGHVYSWGNNEFGQLGNGTTICSSTPQLIESLKAKHVIDIKCGHYHTMVLTQSGEMYAWGYNRFGQIGNGSNQNQLTPVLINSCEQIIAISCGQFHSLAISNNNKQVFSWGNNLFGQLGTCDNENQNIPTRVNIENQVIEKISCGSNHSLLLTADGDIYSFGCNMFGQLGNGSTMHKKNPIRLKLKEPNKFVDIAATFDTDISVALSVSGNCFMWGNNTEEYITVPRETELKSIHEVFGEYFEPQFTYKPIYL